LDKMYSAVLCTNEIDLQRKTIESCQLSYAKEILERIGLLSSSQSTVTLSHKVAGAL